MITLKNGTKGTSQIGYLAKISDKDGYFEVAGIDDDPIGVISQSVPPNADCEIITYGETLIYMHKRVRAGSYIRQQDNDDGAVKGTCVPYVPKARVNVVAQALESGRGLVRCLFKLNFYNAPICSREDVSGEKSGVFAYITDTHSATETTVTTAGTYVAIANALTTEILENFKMDAPYVTFTGDIPRYFKFNYAAAIQADSNGTTVHLVIQKNGVSVPSSEMSVYIKTSGEEFAISGIGVVFVSPGDQLQMMVTSDGDGDKLKFDHLSRALTEFFD